MKIGIQRFLESLNTNLLLESWNLILRPISLKYPNITNLDLKIKYKKMIKNHKEIVNILDRLYWIPDIEFSRSIFIRETQNN